MWKNCADEVDRARFPRWQDRAAWANPACSTQIQPGLGLAVREISEAFNKGRHTTTVRQLFPLEGGGYVADTPGMRSLALWDTEPEELDGYFPELAPLV